MIKGTGVALITPFNADKSVDFEGLEQVVNHCIEGGVDYLVALGTTAETATLSEVEKEQVVECIVKANAGRKPLVIGHGGNNTQSVIDDLSIPYLKHADALLCVSPYYNKPTQEGIYQHFAAIAKATDKQIILYNVPGRTASNMSAETTIRLAKEFSNIVAIKEASGDLEQCMVLVRDSPKDFLVISGEDGLTLPMLAFGMHGVISVIANVLPKEFSEMVNLGLEGDVRKGGEIQVKLTETIRLLFAEGNPAGAKLALEELGVCKKYVRLPLVEGSESLRKAFKIQL